MINILYCSYLQRKIKIMEACANLYFVIPEAFIGKPSSFKNKDFWIPLLKAPTSGYDGTSARCKTFASCPGGHALLYSFDELFQHVEMFFP